MTQNPAPDDNAFWVHCPRCSHAWIAAYLPMAVSTFARIGTRTVCPKCGSTAALCGAGEERRPADYIPVRDGHPEMKA